MMSGSMSYCSKANQLPVRPQPVCTSSTISTASAAFVAVATRWTNSFSAGIVPPSPCTNSRMTAAGGRTPPLASVSADSSHVAQLTSHVRRDRPKGQRAQ